MMFIFIKNYRRPSLLDICRDKSHCYFSPKPSKLTTFPNFLFSNILFLKWFSNFSSTLKLPGELVKYKFHVHIEWESFYLGGEREKRERCWKLLLNSQTTCPVRSVPTSQPVPHTSEHTLSLLCYRLALVGNSISSHRNMTESYLILNM